MIFPRVFLVLLAFALPAAAQTTGKQPVLVSIKRMSLDTALKAARAAIEACRKEGVQVAVTVVDRGGDAQVVLRDVRSLDSDGVVGSFGEAAERALSPR